MAGQKKLPISKAMLLTCLLWTALLAALLARNIRDHYQEAISSAQLQARITVNKDISFRNWSASHGGVYVKPTDKYPPNPYLKVPNRDIVTTDGTQLTLVNPAYMMRQLYEGFQQLDGIRGHITSLKLMNPNNAPDTWEREALLSFEKGVREKSELVRTPDGKEIYRYMQPFYIEPGCLKCHGDMGYRVGDVRGGISTIVPMENLNALAAEANKGLLGTYSIVWLIGLAGIIATGRRLGQHIAENERNMQALRLNELRAMALLTLDRQADEMGEAEFMQTGLEEAEHLTLSRLSFLHFIHDNQQDIELAAWSKRTLEYCKTPSESHYPIASAGVWADSARLKKPVMYNELQSLASKRGCPDWHVKVERYLSAPVLEGDQVRLIIGVGNKESDYNGDDLRLLQIIANDLWKVVRRRRAESSLKRYASRLESSNKDLESFNYSVSHVMRAPLRAIDGFSRILLEEYSHKLDEEGRRMLRMLGENSREMGQLVDDILRYSNTMLQETSIDEVNMETMVQEIARELEPAIAGRDVELKVRALPHIRADREMMRQVLLSLLGNAIKFTRHKEKAWIEIGAEDAGNEVIYRIADNGAGFNMEYKGKLFSAFETLHSHGEFDGTGIGLAIVKRIIAKHGGRVWAEGKVNEGATFYFALPKQ